MITTDTVSSAVSYGQLTYPFTPKNIVINAHTPYDNESDEDKSVPIATYVQDHPNVKLKNKDLQKEVKGVGLVKNVYNVKKEEDDDDGTQNFSKMSVSSFSASTLSSKDIVSNALKKGYSPEQAATIGKAKKAYENSFLVTKNPVKTLSTRTYTVS